MDDIIRVEGLYKLFGVKQQDAMSMLEKGVARDEVFKKTGVLAAINNVSFTVKRGSIFCLIGLSGCGKSTLLRCLNALSRPTAGRVLFDGLDVGNLQKNDLLTFRRERVAMVFQGGGLMSHRSVLDNIAYGLEVRGVALQERNARALEMISLTGLDGWENSPISSLSGGMRQRVGIARALANDPEVLLMDEPFSALDPLVRKDMQFELLSLQERLHKTVVFITHDINEAFKLGSMVGIMREGVLVQVATPEEMADNPADSYVADFVDSANKVQLYSVKHIMQKPGCLIHSRDGARSALWQMRQQGMSSAYVVGEQMEFAGVITLDKAMAVRAGTLAFTDAIERDVPRVQEDTLVSELLPVAVAAKFPVAVVDGEGRLRGIVSKAEILATMI